MVRWLLLSAFLLLAASTRAQMINGADTLYGNEWLDFSKTYYRIAVPADGIYRIGYQALADAGFPLGQAPAAELRLYAFGQQVPLFATTDGLLSAQDFIEFYGEKNRNFLDRHLLENPAEPELNPLYSLFNDTAVYYLVWEPHTPALRYTVLPNDLSSPPPAERYCWWTSGYTYDKTLFKRQLGPEIQFSWFSGEGFGTFPESTFSVNIDASHRYADGPPARLSVRYACGLGAHRQRLTVNDSLLREDEFSGWQVVQADHFIPASSLKNNNLVRLASAIGSNDRNSVASVYLRYARLFDFGYTTRAEFWVDNPTESKYLEITAFDASGGGGAPVLYDVVNRTRTVTDLSGGRVKAMLPPAFKERHLWLVNPAKGVFTVERLTPVQFRDYSGEAADYVILSHPAFFADPAQGNANPVAAYADYRRSPAGGGHQVLVVDVNELYEQFAYGVRYHPMAVRNFLHYARKRWAVPPQYLLIIGKGLDYDRFRRPEDQRPLADSLFFVPTFGSPGADMLFGMQGKGLSQPLVAIGRLAVVRPAQIWAYLDKMREHELVQATAPQTLEGKAWMKRVIHNSGGLAGETAFIRAYTQNMADVISANRIGADVHTFYKTSNDPIQLSSYEQMLDLINGGISMWMIFGHSSAFAVDFDIGAPSAYNNKGRYPLMMIMGCFSGLCSANQPGIGEQFVLAPERGAIAYFASVYFSYSDALYLFGRRFYERLGGEDYGQSVGVVLSNTIADLRRSTNPGLIALLHQNLLQGDPAVRLHHYPGPDYVVDPRSARIEPNPAALEKPTLKVAFDLVNLGEHVPTTLPFRIEQRLPDGTLLERRTDSTEAPAFRKRISIEIPTAGSQVGQNRLLIGLNPERTVAEQPQAALFNNQLEDDAGVPGLPLFFFANDVAPIAPDNYAIVRQNPPTLWASTLNPQAPVQRYLFEIDTAETFNSPWRRSEVAVQKGGAIAWKPPVILQDSTVYYWRVARDTLQDGAIAWRQRSFIYIPQSPPGWNQSHFGQWAENDFINMEARDSTRRIEFVPSAGFLSMNVAYRNRDKFPGMQNAYYEGFFGDAGFNGQGLVHGVAVMLQDPNTGRYVPNPPNSTYNNHPTRTRSFFSFNTQDSLQRVALMHFLEHVVPDNFIVGFLALHPWNDTVGYAPRRWAADSVSYGKNLFQILEAQGAEEVRSLVHYTTGPHPYGFIYQKNNPLFDAVDTVVYHVDSVINLRRTFLARWSVGQWETPPVGPARSWGQLLWAHEPPDNPSDEATLSVLAVREGQPDSLLLTLQGVYARTLTDVPAQEFPRLRLRFSARDTLLRTALQPRFVRVLYEPVPEGALYPAAHLSWHADTLQQGEPGRVSVAFVNVSPSDFDSLLLRARFEHADGQGHDYALRLRPLPAGDTLHLALRFDTRDRHGPHRLTLEANPGPAQPEQYLFNNAWTRNIWVSRDVRNPLLDVTFDGVHIADGDIVSPQPVVVAALRDENPYLALSDTTALTLQWQGPDGALQRLYFSDPTVQFFPADPTQLPKHNRARVEWRPTFTRDGEYRLIVNGRDASGNAAGQVHYAIRFRVVTRSALSHLLNYPNPFSTQTCFYYTLTGAEPPARFRLQILTVSGRVVREVTEAEFGPLRAGTHRSEFCWDGRDQYGDPLANGIYLYRVVAKKADGSDFELWENNTVDGFFQKGIGKMVLLR